MRRWNRILALALILLLAFSAAGCRMRILEGTIADVVLEKAEPEPTETPAPTPTPTPEPAETPRPTSTAAPEQTPKPDAPKTPDSENRQLDPNSTIHNVTPGQEGDIEKSKEKITVTLDPNRGTCARETVEVTPGGVYGNLPEAKRTGYSFTGWYFSPNGGVGVTENTIVTIKEDHTLYAHWSASEKHTLTLDPQGGRLLKSELTRDLFPGEVYGALPVPSRPGYRFDGWFTQPEGGDVIAADAVVTAGADQTLYAHWTYDPFAYWSFVLQNTNEALYACQKVSAYLEYDTDNVTPGYSALLADTTVLNVAENRGGGEVDDDWVREKRANVLVKCVSDMGGASQTYSAMQARFPGARILIVPGAAETGSAAQQLYYRLYFAQLMYPDWYTDVDIGTVGAELGVSGSIYGS